MYFESVYSCKYSILWKFEFLNLRLVEDINLDILEFSKYLFENLKVFEADFSNF
jgi:hypothetical protein